MQNELQIDLKTKQNFEKEYQSIIKMIKDNKKVID